MDANTQKSLNNMYYGGSYAGVNANSVVGDSDRNGFKDADEYRRRQENLELERKMNEERNAEGKRDYSSFSNKAFRFLEDKKGYGPFVGSLGWATGVTMAVYAFAGVLSLGGIVFPPIIPIIIISAITLPLMVNAYYKLPMKIQSKIENYFGRLFGKGKKNDEENNKNNIYVLERDKEIGKKISNQHSVRREYQEDRGFDRGEVVKTDTESLAAKERLVKWIINSPTIFANRQDRLNFQAVLNGEKTFSNAFESIKSDSLKETITRRYCKIKDALKKEVQSSQRNLNSKMISNMNDVGFREMKREF